MDSMTTTLDAVCLASQLILENGGETYRAEETVERMCQGLGVPRVDVLALPTGLMLTLTLDEDKTISRIVRVHSRSTDLNRIDECNDISRKVASGNMTAEDALKALQEIKRPQKQKRFIMIVASAVTAASFTLMLGGSWTDFGVSFFCGALVQWVLTPLSKMKAPPLISSMIAGALTTLLALLGAGTAGEAGIGVDLILAVAFADGANRALLGARAASDALVCDLVCHFDYLHFQNLIYFIINMINCNTFRENFSRRQSRGTSISSSSFCATTKRTRSLSYSPMYGFRTSILEFSQPRPRTRTPPALG